MGINVIAPISEAKSIPVNPVSSPIMLPVAHAAKSEDAAASFPWASHLRLVFHTTEYFIFGRFKTRVVLTKH